MTEERAFPAPNTLRRCCYGKSEVEGRAVLCQGKLRGQAQVGNPRDFLTQQPTVGGLARRDDSTGDYVVRVRIKRKLTQENTSRQGPAPAPSAHSHRHEEPTASSALT